MIQNSIVDRACEQAAKNIAEELGVNPSPKMLAALAADLAEPPTIELMLTIAVDSLRRKVGPKCSVWAGYESGYSQFSTSQAIESGFRVQLLGSGPMISTNDPLLSVACDKALAEWTRSIRRREVAERIERELEAADKATAGESYPHTEVEGAMPEAPNAPH